MSNPVSRFATSALSSTCSWLAAMRKTMLRNHDRREIAFRIGVPITDADATARLEDQRKTVFANPWRPSAGFLLERPTERLPR